MKLQKFAVMAISIIFGALSLNANALQISNFDKLTEKQIEQSYFFDWNRNSTFRGSLYKAFKTSGMNMPSWLRKGGGRSAPAKIIQNGSTQFVFLDTCARQQCTDNVIYVLFDLVTKTTVAVGKFDKKVTWIGKPNNNVKQILSKASGLR